jgi:hypothetical protein
MDKFSQAPIGSGSGAANQGLANVPLNSSEDGITPSKLANLLRRVISNNNSYDEELLDEIGEYCDKIKDHIVKKKLLRIGNALQMNNDKRKATRDPYTGDQDPDSVVLAKKLLRLIQPMIKKKSNEKGASVVYNHKTAQQIVKRKKKTRGNPFRVLMGKVGKLLDHGVEKNDIIRYLAKLKYWNEETISRAVDIVRDYNRKKQRDVVEEKATKKEKNDVKEEVKDELEMHKSSSSQHNIVTAGYDYETKPDFNKASSADLIFRACYLLDLLEVNKNTPQGDFKEVADKKGAKEELTKIKKALQDRGYDKEELSMIGLGQ